MRFNMVKCKRIYLGRGYDLDKYKGKKEVIVEGRVREFQLFLGIVVEFNLWLIVKKIVVILNCMWEWVVWERVVIKLFYKVFVWQ